jgi:hypothetical protein
MVVVELMNPSVGSKVRNGWPDQFTLSSENNRCSIGLHFEHPVGSWQTVKTFYMLLS